MTDTIADLIERRFGLPTEAGKHMPATGTLAGMLARRVQRRFTSEPVSDERFEVVLAAFVLWGLTPGPLLMAEKPEFAWGLIASMYLGNVALLALNVFAIPLFVQMVKLPYRILAPAVILVCTIGTFSVNGSIVETWLMFGAGVVGFFMRLYGFSPAALVLALVLGPLAEQSQRQTLSISSGSFGIFIERLTSLWILAFTAAVLVSGVLMHSRRARS